MQAGYYLGGTDGEQYQLILAGTSADSISHWCCFWCSLESGAHGGFSVPLRSRQVAKLPFSVELFLAILLQRKSPH